MIMWHGFSDPLASPVDTIDYYNSIRTRSGHNRRDAKKPRNSFDCFSCPMSDIVVDPRPEDPMNLIR
jgi:hypothetical protein